MKIILLAIALCLFTTIYTRSFATKIAKALACPKEKEKEIASKVDEFRKKIKTGLSLGQDIAQSMKEDFTSLEAFIKLAGCDWQHSEVKKDLEAAWASASAAVKARWNDAVNWMKEKLSKQNPPKHRRHRRRHH